MVFAEEAERNGANMLPKVTVRDVIIEDGVAGGVRARGSNGQEYEINSKVVVCAAGGPGGGSQETLRSWSLVILKKARVACATCYSPSATMTRNMGLSSTI